MVRFGVLLALAAFLAVVHSEQRETVFRPGREYVFDYESQIVSGVPINNKVLSGIKFKSTVRMQMKSASRVHLQMEAVKIVKAMDEFAEPYAAEKILPIEMWSEVTGEFKDIMEAHLLKPIKFRYADGRVSDVEVHHSEPYFSLNVKKGLLSLLHVNMQEVGAIEEIPQELMDVITKNSYVKESPYHGVFSAMEENVDGICESIYAIVDYPDASMITPMGHMDSIIMKQYNIEGSAMKVTKVRNYNNCKKRPSYNRGLLSNHICPHCPPTKEADLLVSTAHADYVLTGNRRNFLIHAAVATGKHRITPLVTKNAQPEITVKQLLQLRKVQAPSVTIKPGSSLVTINNMGMELPSHVTDGVTAIVGDATPTQVDKKIQAVEALLAETANMIGEEIEHKATTAINQMVLVAKKIPTPALAALIIKYAKEASSQDPMLEKKKEILLDIIPGLSHPGSVMIIKKLIVENVISQKRAAIMIQALALTMVPNPKMILELLEFAQEDIVKDVWLKKSCLLAAGTFTQKVYQTAKRMVDPYKKIILAEKHKIANELRKLLEVTVTTNAKIVVLKAIGNAGLPETLPQLKNIIEDKTKPVAVRKYAIYALRRIAPLIRRKIQSVLLPKFMDPKEPEEIRIAAFAVLMDTWPGVGMAEAIVHSLRTETSLQVGSLVYSYLKSLSHAKFPKLYRLAHALKIALVSARPFTPGIQYSKGFHWDTISRNMAEGFAIDQFIVTGYKSLLPSAFVSKINMLTMGHSANIFEFGIESHGLQTLVADLFGPAGMLKEWLKGNVPLEHIIKPFVKKTKMASIEEMANKIKMVNRLLTKFDAAAYFKVLGNEIAHIGMNAEYWEDVIEKAKMKLPELTSILSAGYHANTVKTLAMVDNTVKIPSVAGVPIYMKLGAVAVAKLDAYIKVEGLPSIHQWLMNWKAPSEAKIHLRLKPSMVADIHAFLGVDGTILEAGTGFKADVWSAIPAEMKIIYQATKKTIGIEYEVPQAEKDLLKISSSPVAYMKEMPLVPHTTVAPLEIKKILASTGLTWQVPVSISAGEKSLGIGIAIAGNIVHLIREPHTCPVMGGPQNLAIKIFPGADVPDTIEIKFMYVAPGHKAPSVARAIKSIEVVSSAESKEQESYFSLIGWPWSSEKESKESWGSRESRGSLSMSAERRAPACEWSPIVPDTELVAIGIDPTAKHEVIATIRTKGDEMKRYIAAKVAFIPVHWMAHQINAQLIASPAVIPYPQYQKIAVDIVVEVPKYLFYYVPVPFMPEAQPIAKTAVICGAEGYTKKMFDAMLFVGKKVDDRLAGFTPIEAALKVKYSPHSPLGIKKMGVKILDWAKALPHYISRASWNHKYAENAPNEAEVKAHIIPEENIAKIIIETPWETNVYTGISLPEEWLPWKAWKAPVVPHIANHFTDHKLFPGQCKVEGEKVVTFDKVKFTLPPKDHECEMVLAKDCTTAATFAVTAKKAKDHETKMEVKVMGPDNMIVKVIPSGSGWLYGGDKLVVKLNGETREMTHPIIRREVEGKVDSPVTYVIKKEEGVVIIDAKILGVTIITNGDEIEVKASPMFHGKMCGVCGDYDGEMAWEFRGPRMEVYPKGDQFAVSYMIPSDSCKVEEMKHRYKMHDIEIPAEKGNCGILMKHAIKEEMVMGELKKCISTAPIETCGMGCMERDATTKSVPFHCLPANDPATAWTIRKARNEGLADWSNWSEDITATVTAPAMCVPVY